MERRLSAILAADVVGYSALMERDEAGTFDRLKARRKELFEPEIDEHHGRVFKLMGDGLLAEFTSVVDAVECAVALQRGMAERNASAPEDQRIDVRIGINLGEVIVEGEDRYGDGVNVAARLQQLAEPGGICVSGKVSHEVDKKLAFGFEPMGEQRMKNIVEPIAVYRVKLDGPARQRKTFPVDARRWRWAAALAVVIALAAGGVLWETGAFIPADSPGATPALAVLPFTNMAGGEAGQRLADGITEEIITDLSRFRDILVIARNSTEIYKGKPVDIRQVSTDLGVRYVLEGSIQTQSDRVRVTGQLIDAMTATHVWSQRWDRPAGDLFAIQSEVAEAVAAALGGSSNLGAITEQEVKHMRRKPPASLDAYDLYLIAVEGKSLRTKQGVEAGLAALDKAIALDPGFARAYVVRGWLHFFTTDFGVPWGEALKRMEGDMRKGFELDPRDADARAALGFYYSLINKLPESESLIREALELNPNSVHVMLVAAATLSYLGFPEEAAAHSDRAMRLDPRMVPVNLSAVSDSYFWARRFEDVVKVIRRIPPESRSSGRYFELAASYAFLGRAEDSTSARAAFLARRPGITAQAYYAEGWYFAREQEEELFFDSFRILDLPMCATSEQLKWIESPKPLPECPAQKN